MASEFETYDLMGPMDECLVRSAGQGGEVMFVDDHEREVRELLIEELGTMARKLCGGCRRSDIFHPVVRRGNGWRHVKIDGRTTRLCALDAIHDRIAELEAERDRHGE